MDKLLNFRLVRPGPFSFISLAVAAVVMSLLFVPASDVALSFIIWLYQVTNTIPRDGSIVELVYLSGAIGVFSCVLITDWISALIVTLRGCMRWAK